MGIGLFVYDWINSLSPVRHATALAHGAQVMAVEARYHLDPELGLNRWLAMHLGLGRISAEYYDLAHFGVTLGFLAFVWWRHPSRFRFLRNSLAGMNGIGFVVFWLFPVAPPRMLPGFVDIVAVTHAATSLTSGSFASAANQYAAMPSLHVAYAFWCAVAAWHITRGWPASRARAVRILAMVHVVATVIIILATANHFTVDALGGCATAAISLASAAAWARRRVAIDGPARGRSGRAEASDRASHEELTAPVDNDDVLVS